MTEDAYRIVLWTIGALVPVLGLGLAIVKWVVGTAVSPVRHEVSEMAGNLRVTLARVETLTVEHARRIEGLERHVEQLRSDKASHADLARASAAARMPTGPVKAGRHEGG